MRQRYTCDPYRKLAEAIIKQAAVDHMKAADKLKRFPDNPAAAKTIAETEAFFTSEYFAVLTSCNPDYFMRKLKEKESV